MSENNHLPTKDRCKIRCGLFPETPLDSPARSCTFDPEWCGCSKAEPDGFCFQRIPAVA